MIFAQLVFTIFSFILTLYFYFLSIALISVSISIFLYNFIVVPKIITIVQITTMCVFVSWYERCLIAPCQLLSPSLPLRNETNVTLRSVGTFCHLPGAPLQFSTYIRNKYLIFLKKGKTNIYTLYSIKY